MPVNFPPVSRTTSHQEAQRLAKLMGFPNSASVVQTLRDELNEGIARRPVRLDYVDLSPDPGILARVCRIANDAGDEQFWMALHVGHPFVQNMIDDMTPDQRTGAEIVLMTIFEIDATDEKTQEFYVQESRIWGQRLAAGTEILNKIFWPHGKPEIDIEGTPT